METYLLENVEVVLHTTVDWIEMFQLGLESRCTEHIGKEGKESFLEHAGCTEHHKGQGILVVIEAILGCNSIVVPFDL